MVKTKPFDAADHLDNRTVIIAYLRETFQTRDRRLIVRAIGNVARTTGMPWREKTSPKLTAVLRVLDAAGVQLTVSARHGSKKRCRYTLEKLIGGMTEENRHPEIDWGPPRGKEAW
jgi:DNA-binding phage protein